MANLDEDDARSRNGLFDIPLELRNMVYAHLLKATYTDTFHPVIDSHHVRIPAGETSDRLVILRISQQVYREALPILYRESVFQIGLHMYFSNTPSFTRQSTIMEPSAHLRTGMANLLQNIELTIDMRLPSSEEHGPISTQLLHSLHIFNVPGLRRESCHLRLRYDWWLVRSMPRDQRSTNAFLATLEELSVFRILKIQSFAMVDQYQSAGRIWQCDSQGKLLDHIFEGQEMDYIKLREHLDSMLGPSECDLKGLSHILIYRPADWKAGMHSAT